MIVRAIKLMAIRLLLIGPRVVDGNVTEIMFHDILTLVFICGGNSNLFCNLAYFLGLLLWCSVVVGWGTLLCKVIDGLNKDSMNEGISSIHL